MEVVKRTGCTEKVNFNKVVSRVEYLAKGIQPDGIRIGDELDVNYIEIAQNVIGSITNKITTEELDHYAAKVCASRVDIDYDYGVLGGRIEVSNLHKITLGSFSDTMKIFYEHKDEMGNNCSLLKREFYKNVERHADTYNQMIDYTRDYRFDYFGIMTLQKSYLMRCHISSHKVVMERPQHMYMRVAVELFGTDFDNVKRAYDYYSQGYISHASPTMYNAGTPNCQLSSCFLFSVEDALEGKGGILHSWSYSGMTSKHAGGEGHGISSIRCNGSRINGVNGKSSGIVPFIRVWNEIARCINQGGRRPGAFAMYLEPWHGEIRKFLELKKIRGKEEMRARDLFYALWIPDLFMKRLNTAITENRPVAWSLMCPHEHRKPGYKPLYDLYGAEFERVYEEYEREGLYRERVEDIRDLWLDIVSAQQETGVPYILYKDHVNHKNNQMNLGTIRNSNLCAEIVQYNDKDEHAVCNLASLALNRFVVTDKETGVKSFDYEKLYEVAKFALVSLDKVIDINLYPTPEGKTSNRRHRPVGLGVQGLADVYMMLKYSFDSDEAADVNRKIFETIYFGTMNGSMELARERQLALERGDEVTLYEREKELTEFRGAYSSFKGSPLQQGKFQFDLWNEKPNADLPWDWDALRSEIMKYGVRNSLTTAIMPTASTAQILGNTECIEPMKYNLYTRRVISGEFTLLNKHMQRDMKELGLWNADMRKRLMEHRGSIQNIPGIPEELKRRYKTAFELSQKAIINQARGRGPFIDQTQSMNIFVPSPDKKKLTAIHLYTWKLGLKTGMYYLRRQTIANAVQFTVSKRNSGSPVKVIRSSDLPQEEEAACTSCSA